MIFATKVPICLGSQFYRQDKLRFELFKMKEEEVEVDETFSMRFEDPIPAKRIKQEPVEERKAFVEVATQTETLENDVEVLKFSLVLKSEIQNLKQRVDSGFKEADERMARIQETIEKSDGLNSKQAVLVKPKVTSEVDKSQSKPMRNSFHKRFILQDLPKPDPLPNAPVRRYNQYSEDTLQQALKVTNYEKG